MQLASSLEDKKKKLAAIIRRENRAAVACSGGVDSTLLLKVCFDVLGHENTMAVFAETPLLPPGEAEAAKEVINLIGSRLLTVSLNPLVWPEFVENPGNRCYLCKKKIYQSFLEKLGELQFKVLMDGTNLDDLSDFRPGLKALHELKIKTPLAEAGFSKKEIREYSKSLNLPNWNKHSSSCLATRIAAGLPISNDKLALIRKCEDLLHSLDFWGCRVRIFDDSVNIELQEKDFERFAKGKIRHLVLKKFNDFNIKNVFLDVRGRKEVSS